MLKVHTGVSGDVHTLSSSVSWFLLVILEDLPLGRSQCNGSAAIRIWSRVGGRVYPGKTVVSLDDRPESSRNLQYKVATFGT